MLQTTNINGVKSVCAGALNVAHARKAVAFAAALLLALLVALGAGKPAEAHGTTVPYHQSTQAACSDYYNRVTSHAPNQIRSYGNYNEAVLWRPTLYRYTSSGWQVYRNDAGWLGATAGPNGFVDTNIGGQMISGPGYTYTVPNMAKWYRFNPLAKADQWNFGSLPPGYYALVESYMWNTTGGSQHTQWQPFSNGTTTCTIS